MAFFKSPPLWRWDSDVYMDVADALTDSDYVHFSRGASIYSLHPSNGKVAIPNVLLQAAGRFDVYAYLNATKTLIKESFNVEDRPQPPEYVYNPTPVITYPELVELVTALVAWTEPTYDATTKTLTIG